MSDMLGRTTIGGTIVTGTFQTDDLNVIDDAVVGDDFTLGDYTVDDILDEDNMTSNSNTSLITQQSSKAYADLIRSAGVVKTTTSYGFTDNGDGTFDLTGGDVFIRVSNANNSLLVPLTITNLTSQSIATNTRVYVTIEYPNTTFQVSTSNNSNGNDKILVYEVYRNDTVELHPTPVITTINDIFASIQKFTFQKYGVNRTTGLIISTSSLSLLHTSGTLWSCFTEITVPAFDSSGSDTFCTFYRDGVGGWVHTCSISSWSDTLYDNGSGTLATLTNNRYGIHEVFIESDGQLAVVYGQGDYVALAAAETADVISDLPPRLTDHAEYLGRIVFQKSAGVSTTVLSSFTNQFNFGSVSSHSNLSNLGSDDHVQYALLNGRSGDTLKIDDITEFTTDNGVNIETNVLVDGKITINSSTEPTRGRLKISGTVASSTDGPHIELYSSQSTTYPIFQLLGYSRDGQHLAFDSYYDGSNWRSSSLNSNFRIQKNTDSLDFFVETGIGQGGIITWDTLMKMNTDTSIDIHNTLKVDTVTEFTTDNGVDIESVVLKDGIITVDTINEKTTNNGVEIEGITLKDGNITKSGAFMEVDLVSSVQDMKFTVKNSDATYRTVLEVEGDIWGDNDIRVTGAYTNSITGDALYVDSSGNFGTISSLRNHKLNINYSYDHKWIYDLKPVSFNFKVQNKKTRKFINEARKGLEYGLIAEDVEKINKELCTYDKDGKLTGVAYRKLITTLVTCVQEQKKEIDFLKKKLISTNELVLKSFSNKLLI